MVQDPRTGALGAGLGGALAAPEAYSAGSFPCRGFFPSLHPEFLGNRAFLEAHRVRMPYVLGAMARGIASKELVIAAARAGLLAFFGAAGLPPDRIRDDLRHIRTSLPEGTTFGCNIIHNPQEPHLEAQVADLLIEEQVDWISASAYMDLRPSLIKLAFSGLRVQPNGVLVRPRHIFAKISRTEVAQAFMRPPSPSILEAMVAEGQLSQDEAQLAQFLPVAEDVTVESDSGGHTDGRPLPALLPEILLLRDRLVSAGPWGTQIRIGAAGGLGTPQSVAAAFAMGADFVLTGSVNQACVESGLHPTARAMLQNVGIADMGRCPSADMFEIGAEVQVLKKGCLFPQRARRLQDLYKRHNGLSELSDRDIKFLERDIFRSSLSEAWESTASFWSQRKPDELERANTDPRHQMALLFRTYLGLSSRWPMDGTSDRRMDYQVWTGPAQGAFNSWVEGSFLEPMEGRTVVQVALNLMEGAAQTLRAQALRSFGVPLPARAFSYRPRSLNEHPSP